MLPEASLIECFIMETTACKWSTTIVIYSDGKMKRCMIHVVRSEGNQLLVVSGMSHHNTWNEKARKIFDIRVFGLNGNNICSTSKPTDRLTNPTQ